MWEDFIDAKESWLRSRTLVVKEDVGGVKEKVVLCLCLYRATLEKCLRKLIESDTKLDNMDITLKEAKQTSIYSGMFICLRA